VREPGKLAIDAATGAVIDRSPGSVIERQFDCVDEL